MLIALGCASKPAAKTDPQDQQAVQHTASNPSIIGQHELKADSVNQHTITRRLIKRAYVGALAKAPGKIVVVICVDQSGKVISAKFVPEKSSPKLIKLARQAEEIAKEYVFEENYLAPLEECGQLTFVFKLK